MSSFVSSPRLSLSAPVVPASVPDSAWLVSSGVSAGPVGVVVRAGWSRSFPSWACGCLRVELASGAVLRCFVSRRVGLRAAEPLVRLLRFARDSGSAVAFGVSGSFSPSAWFCGADLVP